VGANRAHPGEKTLKLNLLFFVMDLLIVLAYPIVFVHGKWRQFSKPKERFGWANLLVQPHQADNQWTTLNTRKKGLDEYSNNLFPRPANT
jgi:hypothetical protein